MGIVITNYPYKLSNNSQILIPKNNYTAFQDIAKLYKTGSFAVVMRRLWVQIPSLASGISRVPAFRNPLKKQIWQSLSNLGLINHKNEPQRLDITAGAFLLTLKGAAAPLFIKRRLPLAYWPSNQNNILFYLIVLSAIPVLNKLAGKKKTGSIWFEYLVP